MSAPAYNERYAGTAVEFTVFSASQRAGRFMRAVKLGSAVIIAVVKHRAVVAGEYNYRITGYAERVEFSIQFADAPVKLGDNVSARAEICRALKSL